MKIKPKTTVFLFLILTGLVTGWTKYTSRDVSCRDSDWLTGTWEGTTSSSISPFENTKIRIVFRSCQMVGGDSTSAESTQVWAYDGTFTWDVDIETGNYGWKLVTGGTEADLNKVHFADSKTGTIAANNGLIMNSSTGGESWLSRIIPSYSHFVSVIATGAEDVYMGAWDTVYTTHNGGASWTGIQFQTGKQTKQFSVDKLPEGFYLCRIAAEGWQKVMRIAVL